MQGKTSFMGFNAQYIEIYFSRSSSYNQMNSFGILFGSNPQETFSVTKNTHLFKRPRTHCLYFLTAADPHHTVSYCTDHSTLVI